MLIASHVIHVVGPRYRAGQDNEAMLRDAVFAALDAAVEYELESMAFPAISAGVFGYPLEEATKVLTESVIKWLQATPNEIVEIRLTGFSNEVAQLFAAAIESTRAT
jgi:O-acetyl-ADP-ribose deacetylase (regulator of RNase III)